MSKIFTTGQIAKMLSVAPRTVSKWFDSGRLRGYRIPGSQDRRIPEPQLVRFLAEYGMPFPDEVGFIVMVDDGGFIANAETQNCIGCDQNPLQAARSAQRFSTEDEAVSVVNLRKQFNLGGKVIRVTDVNPAPVAETV